jgi:hypothetical protein
MVTEDRAEDCWAAFNKECKNQLLEKEVCDAWVEPRDFEAPYPCKIASVIQLTLTFTPKTILHSPGSKALKRLPLCIAIMYSTTSQQEETRALVPSNHIEEGRRKEFLE